MRGREYKNRYDFGFRKMGDSQIGHVFNTHIWKNSLNVELIVRCKADKDHIISNAEIQFDQSLSGIQGAKIVGGAIGTNFIEILIYAENTFWMRYDAKFYGNQRNE